jgi:hypothetical protein
MQTLRTLWLHEGRFARVAVRGVSNTVLGILAVRESYYFIGMEIITLYNHYIMVF